MFNRRCFRQMPNAFAMQDGMIDIDNNSGNIDLDFFQQQQTSATNNQAMPMQQGYSMAAKNGPIMEPMQERVVQRTIVHEVPHVCPIRTKIINNHVFKHTYSPNYTCCEENVCTNVQCGSCCNY